MQYTSIVNTKKKKDTLSKIKKFEETLNKSLDFIDNHKQVSEEEKELIELSFETMLDFLNHKSEELK